MFKKISVLSALTLWCAGGLMADFTYEQTSKITGGAIAGMMKLAGAFSKSAREPMVSTISVKGDRMVTRHADTAQVIDLNSETITDIDFKKKTFSTITFAQMTQALQEASRKMQEQRAKSKDAEKAEIKFKASVKETGQSKQIQGMNAKQMIMKLDMEGTDKDSGQKGSMQVLADMWMAPSVSGYDEVQQFYKRMGEKLAWTPGGMGVLGAMAQPGMAEGMSELYKQASKLDGVPVLQITRMGAVAEGQDLSSVPSQTEDGAQAQVPSAGNVAGQAAGQAAAGAATSRLGRAGSIGGALGGFGGFGRRKKQQQEEQAPPQQTQPEQQQAGPAAGQPALLMEMTSELTSFSSASVDAANFEVPAGFKQVENEMVKRMK